MITLQEWAALLHNAKKIGSILVCSVCGKAFDLKHSWPVWPCEHRRDAEIIEKLSDSDFDTGESSC